MTKAYLSCLPRKFIRAMASFPKEGQFHLRRAQVEPSTELKRLVWPDVEGWLERYDRRIRHGRPLSFAEGGVDDDDLAGQGFLRYLQELRIILLQDGGVLQYFYPDSPFFSY